MQAPKLMNDTNQLNFWVWRIVSASKRWSQAIERQQNDQVDKEWDRMREAENKYFEVWRKIKGRLDE